MVLLEQDPFLTELKKMYERSKDSGTVWITMKRSNLKPRKTRQQQQQQAAKPGKGGKGGKAGGVAAPPAAPSASDYRCLIRANDGKRHISTLVPVLEHQYAKFQQSLTLIMKSEMAALKTKKKEKAKPAGKAGDKAADK